jgi:hypothetical protein
MAWEIGALQSYCHYFGLNANYEANTLTADHFKLFEKTGADRFPYECMEKMPVLMKLNKEKVAHCIKEFQNKGLEWIHWDTWKDQDAEAEEDDEVEELF